MLDENKLKDKNGIYLEGTKKEEALRDIFKEDGDQTYQVIRSSMILKDINERCKVKELNLPDIDLRYYEDEYQMPIMMAKVIKESNKRSLFKKKEKTDHTYLWTNMNSPVKEARASINVFCEVEGDLLDASEDNYVKDVIISLNIYLIGIVEEMRKVDKIYLFRKICNCE